MRKWEYRTVNHNSMRPFIGRELNHLGEQGWELCGVVTSISSCPDYIFKREMEEENNG